MKRKQIYIEEDLDSRLKATAVAEQRSAAAIIRDAVRAYLDRPSQFGIKDPFLEIAGSIKGGPANSSLDHDRFLYRQAR